MRIDASNWNEKSNPSPLNWNKQNQNPQQQQRQVDEVQLSRQLQMEQGKLTELSDQVNGLDRMLQQLQPLSGETRKIGGEVLLAFETNYCRRAPKTHWTEGGAAPPEPPIKRKYMVTG